MNDKLLRKIFYASSALIFAAGIISTALVIHKTGDALAFANRRHQSYRKLCGLFEEHKKNESLLKLLESAAEPGAPDPAAILASFSFETKPDIRDRAAVPVYPPYTLRESEIIFKNETLKTAKAVNLF